MVMSSFGQLFCEAKPQTDLRLESPNCEVKGIKGSVFSPIMINVGLLPQDLMDMFRWVKELIRSVYEVKFVKDS